LDAQTTGIIASLITGAIAVIGNLIISARTSGKTEGAIREALKSHTERLDKVEDDNRDQWSKIGEHTRQIGYLEGRVNGGSKAHSHSGD